MWIRNQPLPSVMTEYVLSSPWTKIWTPGTPRSAGIRRSFSRATCPSTIPSFGTYIFCLGKRLGIAAVVDFKLLLVDVSKNQILSPQFQRVSSAVVTCIDFDDFGVRAAEQLKDVKFVVPAFAGDCAHLNDFACKNGVAVQEFATNGRVRLKAETESRDCKKQSAGAAEE